MTLEIIITLMSILAPIQGGVHSNYVLPEQISISKVSENSTVGSVYWTRKVKSDKEMGFKELKVDPKTDWSPIFVCYHAMIVSIESNTHR